MEPILQNLLQSTEASIQFRTRSELLREETSSPAMAALREQIRSSSRVQSLLSERDDDGCIPCHPYKKWYGAHWVLVSLAELGYPPGDQTFYPLREQVLTWLFSEHHFNTILNLQGRTRRCASQESNAVFSLLSLGIADERVDELVHRLLEWQWLDGGWNCDRNPDAHHSSFMETITPLRALTLYARITGKVQVKLAVERAAEVFLKRQLYLRQLNGNVMDPAFTQLHFPLFWHYDILFGLKILKYAGFLKDERCNNALELLKTKQLPSGGFPAQGRYYRPANPKTLIPIPERVSGYSLVDWGPTGKTQMNEFVTVDALAVLQNN